MSNKWFETHAHLSDPQFDADRDEVVKTAKAQSIRHIVEIADGPTEWAKAQSLAERYPDFIYWAAGFHPYYADQLNPENGEILRSFSSHPSFVAVGEIGLDYAKCTIPKATQITTFKKLLSLANEMNKPVIIHCRDAYPDLIPILLDHYSSNKKGSVSPGVVHCFSGSETDADQILKLGFYLGVDGPLTYPKADGLRQIFATIPIEKIVLETDSPYLPPQPHRGKRNQPIHLSIIGEKLADIRGLSVEFLQDKLMTNSLQLFRLKTA